WFDLRLSHHRWSFRSVVSAKNSAPQSPTGVVLKQQIANREKLLEASRCGALAEGEKIRQAYRLEPKSTAPPTD
ncbi:MAG: hypothetical protein RR360_07310, partial [Raoultibacter sp.]